METLKTVVTVNLNEVKDYQLLNFSSDSYLYSNRTSTSNTLSTSSIDVKPLSPIPDKGILFLESLMCPNKFAYQNTSYCTFAYSIGANDYSLNLQSSEVSFTDIVTDLNTYFAANTPAISVAYNSNTGAFTFTYAGGIGADMIIKFAPDATLSNQYSYLIFGALAKNYTLSAGNSLTLGLAALGPLNLVVRVTPWRASSITTDSGIQGQFIVPIDCNFNDIIDYQRETGLTNIAGCYSPFTQNENSTGWKISLLDDKGITYTLSNVVWNITFGLIYD